jgi:hypothetical protein
LVVRISLALLISAVVLASGTANAVGFASPPTVVTGSASNIGPSSATVAGTVNPQGLATTYLFEYGKTTSYGSKTASKSAGSVTSTLAVSTSISSLSPGTTYHYRIVATSSAGTSKGADRSFSTIPPPTVATGEANNIGPTSATVAGTVNPQGLATTYLFEYGKTTKYGSKTASKSAGSGTSTVAVSSTISSLSPGTTYHYRIVATSSAGTSKGADRNFKTGTQSVTIANARRTVVYGRSTTLTGTVSSQRAGETLSVLAQPFGQTSFGSIASVSTTANGGWTHIAQPTIRTTYKVQWQSVTSAAVTIQVRPRISLGVRRGLFYVKAAADHSLAGKVVYFQRLSSFGQWVIRKKLVLNARSAKRFRAKLPHGRSRVRVFLPQAQAGPGYLAGVSRALVLRRP